MTVQVGHRDRTPKNAPESIAQLVCASSFLDSLGLTPAFFDAAQDHCYCEQCAKDLPSSMLQCSQIYELLTGMSASGFR